MIYFWLIRNYSGKQKYVWHISRQYRSRLQLDQVKISTRSYHIKNFAEVIRFIHLWWVILRIFFPHTFKSFCYRLLFRGMFSTELWNINIKLLSWLSYLVPKLNGVWPLGPWSTVPYCKIPADKVILVLSIIGIK